MTSSILVRFGLVLRHRFCAAVVRQLKQRKVGLEFLSFPFFYFEHIYLLYVRTMVPIVVLTISLFSHSLKMNSSFCAISLFCIFLLTS